ncbi:hypothetical protein [Nocardia noduli]|uniref:hypothetical protein n=1 Tax=Nocardia noduli TaxID=2815722 RepID=UPI001C23F143|nr:hypothetical protein [Nocardia noduli]
MDDTTGDPAAEIYVEARDTPIAGGRWHVHPDDTVLYERPGSDEREPSTISADLIRSSQSWKRLTPPGD